MKLLGADKKDWNRLVELSVKIEKQKKTLDEFNAIKGRLRDKMILKKEEELFLGKIKVANCKDERAGKTDLDKQLLQEKYPKIFKECQKKVSKFVFRIS